MDAWVRTTTRHSLLKQLIEAIAFGVRHVGSVQMTRALDHSVLNGFHRLRVSGFIGHLQLINNEMNERMAGETDGRQVTEVSAYSQWRRSCCILCVQVDSDLLALQGTRAGIAAGISPPRDCLSMQSELYARSLCPWVRDGMVLSAYHE